MKIILSSYFWGFMLLRRGIHTFDNEVHIFGNGVHVYENNIIFILFGVNAFEKGVNFLEKEGSRL